MSKGMETAQQIIGIATLKQDKLENERLIDLVKSTFTAQLAERLNLIKVTAPIAVDEKSGLNDDLNGIERPVCFPVKSIPGKTAVIVHSLAKWKRKRLGELNASPGVGILTDMKALRPDEDLGPIHSVYVDQWDWEMCLSPQERNIPFLKSVVEKIYEAFLETERVVCERIADINPLLPAKITYIHAQELLNMYPELTGKEREIMAAKEHGAIFLMGIGGALSNGEAHDGRAPDYDDWSTETAPGQRGLNGDIIVWNPVLNSAFELSSMGIRVDVESLTRQLDISGCPQRASMPFHELLLKGQLPQTIGGGIGQSRVCMFMLRKKHIGEVQASIWPDEMVQACRANGVELI
jgi:aspartate--ammonia ligase